MSTTAKLYTINNNYPDVNFNFSLTPNNMEMAVENHIHEISSIENLSAQLDEKSNNEHTHSYVSQLYNDTLDNTYHSVYLNSNSAEFNVNNIETTNILSIIYHSEPYDVIRWVANDNKLNSKSIALNILNSDSQPASNINNNVINLNLKGNKYA